MRSLSRLAVTSGARELEVVAVVTPDCLLVIHVFPDRATEGPVSQ
jgi:hypothetical protein